MLTSPGALVHLGLGSNLGRRAHALSRALVSLALRPDLSLIRTSRVYATAAWGVEDQPDFLNMAAAVQTCLPPQALLAVLKELESSLGRTPTYRWGPRVVDIDILTYGELHLETPELTLPHPRLTERQFVLAPLSDIAPDLVVAPGRRVVDLAGAQGSEVECIGRLAEVLRGE